MRHEHADVFYNVDPTNIYYAENDAYNYFRLFPNVRLTFKLDPFNNLSLFFNNRVDRPGEPNLRVFPKYDDPELLKVGNPYVRPQFTQTYEAAYKRIWDSGSLFLAAYYRNLESPFLKIFSIDDSNPNYTIINKIYQNVASGSNTGLEVLLSQKVGNIWNLSAGFNWYNNTIDAFSGTLLFPFVRPFMIDASSDQTWDLKLNNQIAISPQTELQLTAIYQADEEHATRKTTFSLID